MSQAEINQITGMLRAGRRKAPDTLAGLREWADKSLGLMPLEPSVTREDHMLGELPVAWFRPQAPLPHAALLYFHGGAYIMGSIDTHAGLTGRLAAATSMACLSVDYRLAPEHRFPCQLEDALTAYRWLLDQGIPPARIVIAGDSAGGGLVLSSLCAARDTGLPLPAAAVCISPWVDLEGLGDSMVSRAAVDPMLHPDDLAPFRRLFLGNAHPREPKAAPLYADLTGLPPLLIHVGDREILLDDATRIAAAAQAAGVDVSLEIWDRLFHVWHLFAPVLEEGREGITRIAEFVRGRVG
jgi:monoterpene epsilon-lactone hydrolase